VALSRRSNRGQLSGAPPRHNQEHGFHDLSTEGGAHQLRWSEDRLAPSRIIGRFIARFMQTAGRRVWTMVHRRLGSVRKGDNHEGRAMGAGRCQRNYCVRPRRDFRDMRLGSRHRSAVPGDNVISRTGVAMDVRQQEPETGKPMRPGVRPPRCRHSSFPQCELPQLLND
jgi:hypothetical protein